jgi:DNA-binding GntR family transcriptional regulator
MSVTLQRRGFADGAYEALRAMIFDQDIAPAARMNIDLLAIELGVSQTPVREALARLEADGLVVKRPQGGYFAAPLVDESTFEQLYEVRLMLEPDAAGLAARNFQARDIRALQSTLEEMSRVGTGHHYREYKDFAKQDSLFHTTMATASGNAVLADAVARLRFHHQISRLYMKMGVDESGAIREHRAILEAVEHREDEAAREAMRRHIEGSRARLRDFVRSNGATTEAAAASLTVRQ